MVVETKEIGPNWLSNGRCRMRQWMREVWMARVVILVMSTCLVEGLCIKWEEGMDYFKKYLVY